jgi:hypothetical protein
VVRMGDVDTLEMTLANARARGVLHALLEERDLRRQTALHVAAYAGHHEVVDMLLRSGAAADALDGAGESPLHKAAGNGHAEAVRVLLGAGAENIPDRRGQTALYKAALCGKAEVVEVMLSGGSWSDALLKDLSRTDIEGRSTPIHAALSRGHSEVYERLLACVPDEAQRRRLLNEKDRWKTCAADLLVEPGAAGSKRVVSGMRAGASARAEAERAERRQRAQMTRELALGRQSGRRRHVGSEAEAEVELLAVGRGVVALPAAVERSCAAREMEQSTEALVAIRAATEKALQDPVESAGHAGARLQETLPEPVKNGLASAVPLVSMEESSHVPQPAFGSGGVGAPSAVAPTVTESKAGASSGTAKADADATAGAWSDMCSEDVAEQSQAFHFTCLDNGEVEWSVTCTDAPAGDGAVVEITFDCGAGGWWECEDEEAA